MLLWPVVYHKNSVLSWFSCTRLECIESSTTLAHLLTFYMGTRWQWTVSRKPLERYKSEVSEWLQNLLHHGGHNLFGRQGCANSNFFTSCRTVLPSITSAKTLKFDTITKLRFAKLLSNACFRIVRFSKQEQISREVCQLACHALRRYMTAMHVGLDIGKPSVDCFHSSLKNAPGSLLTFCCIRPCRANPINTRPEAHAVGAVSQSLLYLQLNANNRCLHDGFILRSYF